MSEIKDRSASIINRAIDLLFVKQPLRTSIGVILGCVIAFFVQLFLPTLATLEFANFAGAPLWGCVAVGILLLHLPTFISLMSTTYVGNENVSDAVTLIEKANFTPLEKRQVYRNLVAKVIEAIVLDQRTNRTMRDVQQRIDSEAKRR